MDKAGEWLRRVNPWREGKSLPPGHDFRYKRPIVGFLFDRAVDRGMDRSIVVHGQQGAGKTTALRQLMGRCLEEGRHPPGNVLYVPYEYPALRKSDPTATVREFRRHIDREKPALVVFDDIHLIEDWERQVKSLTDHDRYVRIAASVSVDTVQHRRSRANTYGRLLRAHLPPVLFAEFLDSAGRWPGSLPRDPEGALAAALPPEEVSELNMAFLDYLRWGSMAEMLSCHPSPATGRRLADSYGECALWEVADLYGARNKERFKELYRIIARNSGNRLSLKHLADKTRQSVGSVARHVELLEASHCIRLVSRIKGKNWFTRHRQSYRYVLESPTQHMACGRTLESLERDGSLGRVIGAIAYSQHQAPRFRSWMLDLTSAGHCRYADGGKRREVDLAVRNRRRTDSRLCSFRWSDDPAALRKAAADLAHVRRVNDEGAKEGNEIRKCICTTKSRHLEMEGSGVSFVPTAQYCVAQGLEYQSTC